MKKVLFVCVGNACRSIMAEGLTRYYWKNKIEAASGGTHPLGDVPDETLHVLKELGVNVEGLYSKHVREHNIGDFDLIISLCGCDVSDYIPIGFKGKVINYYVKDPYMKGLDSYRQTRDIIKKLVLNKLPLWLGLGGLGNEK